MLILTDLQGIDLPCDPKRDHYRSNEMPDQNYTSKYCGGCALVKPSHEFHISATQCKSCKRDYDRCNKLRFAERRFDSPSSTTEYRRKWNQENKCLKNSYTKKRRAKIKKATPLFADTKAMRQFYNNRPTGMHVDHIIPITSDVVCGLHVEWNLQYLTPQQNADKGQKVMQ